MSISIFLPVRKGSERIIQKNTKTFAGIYGGLLKLKLDQLKSIQGLEEIVVSSNDPTCLQIATEEALKNKKIKVFERPEELGMSTTSLEDLIRYVPTITIGSEILWTHVTSPFCDVNKYTQAINKYKSLLDNDSLVSGHDYKEFLLKKDSKSLINNTTDLKWPRTQDLQDLFQINNAIFLCSREQMIMGDRIGENPYFLNMNKVESLDIDEEEDFELAELIYEKLIK